MKLWRKKAVGDQMLVYKALKDGVSPFQSYRWPLPNGDTPGDWVDTTSQGKPALCTRGVHGFLTEKSANAAGNQVFLMEIEGDITKDNEKAAGRRGRLLRQLSGVRSATLGEIADAISKAGGLAAAAKAVGVTEKSLKEAIPEDLYVVGDDGTLVQLRRYLDKGGADVADRVWALDKLPLRVQIAA